MIDRAATPPTVAPNTRDRIARHRTRLHPLTTGCAIGPVRPPRWRAPAVGSRAVTTADAVTFPGARAPGPPVAHRRQRDRARGLRVGRRGGAAAAAPSTAASTSPARSTCFAPLLAAAGWRVVGWDQRGHGDSDHAELYSWDADLRDALAVIDDGQPATAGAGHRPLEGRRADDPAGRRPAVPVRHLVNLDGIPYQSRIPDVAEHERTRMMAGEIAGWLDHRRATADRRAQAGHARRAGPSGGAG